MARIVLDAIAESHLLHHLQIKLRALFEPLRLDQFVLALQQGDSLIEFIDELPASPAGACRKGSRTAWQGRSLE